MIITQASYFDLGQAPAYRERIKLARLQSWASQRWLWPIRLTAIQPQLQYCRWAITSGYANLVSLADFLTKGKNVERPDWPWMEPDNNHF